MPRPENNFGFYIKASDGGVVRRFTSFVAYLMLLELAVSIRQKHSAHRQTSIFFQKSRQPICSMREGSYNGLTMHETAQLEAAQ